MKKQELAHWQHTVDGLRKGIMLRELKSRGKRNARRPSYVESVDQLMGTTQRTQTHRWEEQTGGYGSGEEGKEHRGGGRETQLVGVKTGSRVYCTTWGIEQYLH